MFLPCSVFLHLVSIGFRRLCLISLYNVNVQTSVAKLVPFSAYASLSTASALCRTDAISNRCLQGQGDKNAKYLSHSNRGLLVVLGDALWRIAGSLLHRQMPKTLVCSTSGIYMNLPAQTQVLSWVGGSIWIAGCSNTICKTLGSCLVPEKEILSHWALDSHSNVPPTRFYCHT